MILFRPIAITFSGATVAGSGLVTRATYTVPAGKRAILEHVSILILVSTAAANTTIAIVSGMIGGIAVGFLRIGNSAVITGELNVSDERFVDLQAGDTVSLITINNAAVNSTMALSAVVREYL